MKADQRKRGCFLGGTAPFGYRKGETGELVPVPEQQRAIRKMQRLRANGASLRSISDAMKHGGVEISHVGVGNALAAADKGT